MNPLLDWREWLLALTSGVIGAVAYAFIDDRLRLRRWQRLRWARLSDLWNELTWIYLRCSQANWAPEWPGGQRGLFPGHIDDLQRIQAKDVGIAAGIPPAVLDPREFEIVRNGIPGIRALVRPVTDLLDDSLSRFRHVWDEDTVEHMLEARGALMRIAEWQPPATWTEATAGREIAFGVDLGLKALIALNWLAVIAEDGLPKSRSGSDLRRLEGWL